MSPFAFSIDDRIESFLEHYPDLGRVMQRIGIDPLGDATRTLAALCATAGQDAEAALRRFALAAAKPSFPETEDWTSASLTDLVAHIDGCHHAYLRGEVPRLGRLVDLLTGKEPDAPAAGLREHWAGYARGLADHLHHEVETVFPACLAIERAMHRDSPLDQRALTHSLSDLADNHAASAAALDTIIDRCAALPAAADQAQVQQALCDGLGALRAELMIHDQEEEDILMPAALDLQDVLAGRLRQATPREDRR